MLKKDLEILAVKADEAMRAERRQREFDDQQNESTGANEGFKISRFFNERAPNGPAGRRLRENRNDMMMSLLLARLLDPVYRETYERVTTKLDDLDVRLDRVLDRLRRERERMLEAAPRLEDGRAVFRDRHGQVWTQDGARVPEEQAAAIDWNKHREARTHEDWRANSDARDSASKQKQLLAQHREAVQSGALSVDELKALEAGSLADIEQTVSRQEKALSRTATAPEALSGEETAALERLGITAATTIDGAASFASAPPLAGDFTAASGLLQSAGPSPAVAPAAPPHQRPAVAPAP